MPRLPKSLINLIGLVIALAIIFGFFSYKVGSNFSGLGNVETILRQSAVTILAALGMTYVIISGGIDLSVGSVAAFVSVVIADRIKAGTPPLFAALIGVAAGGICGLISGTLITRLKVVPFIVTLGAMLIARGAAKGISNEQKIDAPQTWLNDLLSRVGDDERWKIFPVGVWLAILLAVVAALMLRYTRFGRHVVSIGSNENAARLCGVPVERATTMVYMLSGLAAGLGGLMLFSKLTVGDPTVGVNLELEAIAAVVIGGASLSGGEGNIAGTILGALIMATIANGCSMMVLPSWVQEIITGSIIVIAVALDRLRARRATAAN